MEDIANLDKENMTAEAIRERGTIVELKEGIPFRVGSLASKEDIGDAVTLIKSGEVVAAQMWGVYGLWVRGDSAEAIKKALKIKRDSKSTKTLSSMMLGEDFLKLIDISAVHPSMRDILTDVDLFQQRFGALCHIRAPIKPHLVDSVPSSMLSLENGRYYMHNLDPTGHILMEPFIRKLNDNGVMFNAVMSVNDHSIGEAEIHDRHRAIEYCAESAQVGILLEDITYGNAGATGSFGILDAEHASAIRDGIVPVAVLEKILGKEVDKKSMKPAKFDQQYHRSIVELELSPADVRAAIIGQITSIRLPK